MKRIFVALLVVFMLVSCSPKGFYQIYNVNSELEKSENGFMYEDEFCKISYDFWDKHGNLSFLFENKSDKDIYVYLTNSFVLKNDLAFDLYTEREIVTSNIMLNTKITDKQRPIVIVPSKSKKYITGSCCEISKKVLYMCERKIDFPSKKTDERTYNYETTPLKFVNRIAYSFENDAADYKYINNEFWISGYFNCPTKYAVRKLKSTDCLSGGEKNMYYNLFHSADRFYNQYELIEQSYGNLHYSW